MKGIGRTQIKYIPQKSPLLSLFLVLVSLGGASQLLVSQHLNELLLSVEIDLTFEAPKANQLQRVRKYVDIAKNATSESTDIKIQSFSFSTEGSSVRKPRQRLLITQYSGLGNYEKMLNQTSSINKMYAKVWGHDIVLLRGTTKILPFQKDQEVPEAQSTYNKVDLLLWALESDYDQILILDTDTLIYDFSVDLTSMISEENMLVALKLHPEDPPTTSRINCGITLWNLRHPLTKKVAIDWDKGCAIGIKGKQTVRGDQYYLRQALAVGSRENAVKAVDREFHYRSATVIKHFIRLDPCSWQAGSGSREEDIDRTANEVSNRFQFNPNTMELLNHTKFYSIESDSVPVTVENVTLLHKDTWKSFVLPKSSIKHDFHYPDFADDYPGCDLKRKSEWKLNSYSQNRTTQDQKRLLIAQYSSAESYSNLFELTSPANRVYAQKWGHDYLTVYGVSFKTELDGPCQIPAKRTLYNKLPILFYALKKKEKYDMLLILDSDALIYNFDIDLGDYLQKDSMLAAHRIRRCDEEKTHNINNGVTLWNLHHPKTLTTADRWVSCAISDLKKAKKSSIPSHGDQVCLQNTIKRNGLADYINALQQEFDFKNGLLVRQYIDKNENFWSSSDYDDQQMEIKQTVTDICTKFSSDCEVSNRLL